MKRSTISPLPALVDRVEGAESFDRAVGAAERLVRRIHPDARRGLHGTDWLGEPLHPSLVHLPLGAWMAAGVMDAARRPDAARALTVIGVAAAVPAAAAGWADWAELRTGDKRVGLVHAATNTAGLLLYAGSIAARYSRRRRLGWALGLAGLSVVCVGGAIGGDMVYRLAAGLSGTEAGVSRAPHTVGSAAG